MAHYTFNFTVREEWTAVFSADSLEEAQALFKTVLDEDINGNELPNYREKNKGLYTEFDENSLEFSDDFEDED